MDFPDLNFPEAISEHIQTRVQEEHRQIWDFVRKKWLVATPEEWVRQHTLAYLQLLGYPASLMAIESGLTTGHKLKRSDALIYKGGKPYILVECKAPHVKLSQATFNQAFNYNTTLRAPFIYLTNGLQHLFWDCSSNAQMAALPNYQG